MTSYKTIVDDIERRVYAGRIVLGLPAKKDDPDRFVLGKYIAYCEIHNYIQRLKLGIEK